MTEQLGFRAHARLLTMLGEQLIKNERVALVELVKNSYDADATQVLVDFRGFAEDFTPNEKSKIVLTDNGVGMTEKLVRTAWMNPATPSKLLEKTGEPKTKLGRVLQGEKGIGRFATFKLGSRVTLTTRAEGADSETTLMVDISALDEGEDAKTSPVEMDIFLEDIPALLDVGTPIVFSEVKPIESAHGTQLEIEGVRGSWNARLIKGAHEDLRRIQPIIWSETKTDSSAASFEVVFLRDGVELPFGKEREEQFASTLDRAVIKVDSGNFNPELRTLEFEVNGRLRRLSIDDPEVRALKPFKDRFLRTPDGKNLPPSTLPEPACGPFDFQFYVFDLDKGSSVPAEFSLDEEQKKLVREHRIYLYRDGIRVYPYGDPEDDWLGIDATRGVEGAGRTLSNDQTVGFIRITQSGNPRLRDKTSREGLLESGPAVDDFRALVSTVLRFLRKEYQIYLDAKERTRTHRLQQHRSDKHVAALRREPGLSPSALRSLESLEMALSAERELSATQLARTEQLAGVGLSVETASHDLILAGVEALRSGKQVVAELKLLDLTREVVYSIATALVTRLEFIAARFRDVQGLFVSTQQRQTDQDVVQLLKRVKSIYARLHEEQGIRFEIDDDHGLTALSTEAAILQALINLIDNATFWLMASPHEPRLIRAFALDSKTLVVSDNGPGVKEPDVPFVFEAFYSGKGEDGKGLGLYIARQNGYRNGFTIDYESVADPRSLPGATFVVRFGASKEVSS